nr:EOG090X0F1W [Eurycercus lamellatus]
MGSNEESFRNADTVLVTGFGPFGMHTTNASIEAVKLLPSLNLEQDLEIKLVTKEIPVTYDYVQTNIPLMWEMYKPKLVVHVGVSSTAYELNLETQAFNTGYCSPDITGCFPNNGVCIPGSCERITTGIDMRKICQHVNHSSDCGVVSCVSDDPGRYLCDFIYYTSLSIDRARVAFVHVPVLNKPYTALQLAQAIKSAIAAMLYQIREMDGAEH